MAQLTQTRHFLSHSVLHVPTTHNSPRPTGAGHGQIATPTFIADSHNNVAAQASPHWAETPVKCFATVNPVDLQAWLLCEFVAFTAC